MGLTGLISSLLGLIQTAMNSSVEAYFAWNFLVLLISLIAFLLVEILDRRGGSVMQDVWMVQSLDDRQNNLAYGINGEDKNSDPQDIGEKARPRKWQWDLVNQFFNCFLYYLLLGSIPYAVDSYTD